MGKVRTGVVKRVSKELVKRYGDRFGTDFESNKKFLSSLGIVVTKKMRNKLIGYVTHLKEMETQVPIEPESEESYSSGE